jgi:phospholipid/cholesterol/gamma-HCH transport system permease protein
MTATATISGAFAALARGGARWLAGWWRLVHLGAVLLVLAASPSSYARDNRRVLLRHLHESTSPHLLGFTVLTTLVSLVLIRIVVVTAVSYGLSQYALEMVVRVLVLELIPLTAALFAALRCTIPHAAAMAQAWRTTAGERADPLRHEVLPRVAAGVFCALMFAAVSCVVALVLAYLSVYGFATSGFPGYTRTVGHVFDPAISLVFALKIVLFGIAVALVPAAAALEDARESHAGAELRGLVRMFAVILAIEAASLVGSYY